MKLRNFRDHIKTDEYCFAVVDTKAWWSSSWTTRAVYRPVYSSYWRWAESGEFCPDVIDQLACAGRAQAALVALEQAVKAQEAAAVAIERARA